MILILLHGKIINLNNHLPEMNLIETCIKNIDSYQNILPQNLYLKMFQLAFSQ